MNDTRKGKTLYRSTSMAFYLPSSISMIASNNITKYSTSDATYSLSPIKRSGVVKAGRRNASPINVYSGDVKEKYNQSKGFEEEARLAEKKRIDWGSHWRTSHLIEEVIRTQLSPVERKYLSSHVSPLHAMHRCSKNHIIGIDIPS